MTKHNMVMYSWKEKVKSGMVINKPNHRMQQEEQESTESNELSHYVQGAMCYLARGG